jgi:hypothetical protein
VASRRGLTDGRGRGGRNGGRGSGAFEKFREAAARNKNNNNSSNNSNKKPSREPGFAEKFLDPAARGELTKHHSGIPKLAARKPKSKAAIHDEFPGKEAQQVLADSFEYENDEDNEEGRVNVEDKQEREKMASLPDGVEYDSDGDDDDDDGEWETVPGGFKLRADPDAEYKEIWEKHYFGVNQRHDPDEQYDDFEASDIEDDRDITVDEDGTYTVGYNPDEDGYGTDPEDSDYEYVSDSDDEGNTPTVKEREGRRQAVDIDPLERVYYPSVLDFGGHPADDVPATIANQVRPLKEHGPGLDDFLEAMYLHPTKFAEIRRYNLPYESRREPMPDIPRMRKNPPFEWVKSHKKFIYVSGFPPFMEGKGDFDNPVHRGEFAAGIASLLEVSPAQVYPASMTSAFVGWKDRYVKPEVAEKVQKKLAMEIAFTTPIAMSKYDGEDWGEFTKESPETIVQLKNMPPRMTAARLARELFPADTDLSNMYGPLDIKQILITSPTSALVRLDSAETVEMAISSEAVQERLAEMGEYPIQYFLAKRDLVPAGFTGPNRGNAARRWGQRLIVDGDVPSDAFFRSHAGCVLMRNLDDNVTEKDIAEFLKPHSASLRDVKGSVEWVTCWHGKRTGRAFVGFDRLGEAEAFVKAMSGRVKGLGDSPVVTKVIKDKKIPGAKPREARPDRTEEELLKSLNNWEQYVDPKEIEELEQLGVNRLALDLAFRAMRFQNSTYGPMDGALRSETLVPEREAGEEYRETVREYIATIKECMGTPEDPGEIYKGFFMPGEAIDLSIFDNEKRRQARIHKRLQG